ncbi:ABC transporter substrate-binding protein [Homoserinimonas sp. OAct 916]|uniref:ABC transporter substrate-binding protein n=1 Tax=Homoserinimonas sp. OAct 916 TaxID=2211450 RepID=UPI000DBE4C5A|nr:ABC transporter substrate-binding protein [Homoserinimonas sp. OAct 916]
MIHSRIARAAALGLVGLVALAGCQAEVPGEEAGQEVEVSRTFVIGAGEVEGLDPILTKSYTALQATANLYAGLVEEEFEPVEGGYLATTGKHINGVIESTETSEDGRTLTYRLVDGLTFADGTPLTSEDVVYSMKRTLSEASYVAGSSSIFMHISDAESQIVAIDESTIEVTLDAQSPALNKFLAQSTFSVVSADAGMANPGKDGSATDYFTNNATPSGPFALEDWAGAESMTLVKNSNYVHAEDVFAEKITILNMPDLDQRYLAVKNGDIDVALQLTPRLVQEAASDEALRVLTMPSGFFYFLGMNPKVAPFDNDVVRQAIAKAIPYEQLMEEVMLGQASPAYGIVPNNMETSIAPDDKTTQYETNTAAAKKLLEDAGLEGLAVELSVSSSDQISVDSAVYIQSALAEIGVTVNISKMAEVDFITSSYSQKLPFLIGNWVSSVQDPFFQMRAVLLTDRATNQTGFSNAKFDELVLTGIDEGDDAERERLSALAQQIVIDEAAFVNLFAMDTSVVTRADVSGIALRSDQLFQLRYLTRE